MCTVAGHFQLTVWICTENRKTYFFLFHCESHAKSFPKTKYTHVSRNARNNLLNMHMPICPGEGLNDGKSLNRHTFDMVTCSLEQNWSKWNLPSFSSSVYVPPQNCSDIRRNKRRRNIFDQYWWKGQMILGRAITCKRPKQLELRGERGKCSAHKLTSVNWLLFQKPDVYAWLTVFD